LKSNKEKYLIKELLEFGIHPKINNDYQYLVWRFCKRPDKANWPAEIAAAKKFYPQYNKDFGFWQGLDLGFKVNSLCFFLTRKGKHLLKSKWKEHQFVLKEKAAPKLEEGKVGEDYESTVKPKKLFNFKTF
tara:strand:+ start:509 stop:901 length:393 start_codon:yes stop_codon:yes gene_type:complete